MEETTSSDSIKEFAQLALERLEYMNHRIKQQKNLDREIADLYERARWDYYHILAMLEGGEIPPVPETVISSTASTQKPDKAPLPPSSSCSRGRVRPVLQLDKNGTVLQRFRSVSAASRTTGIPVSYISVAANANACTRDGSFWKFEDNYGYLEKNRPVVVLSAHKQKKTCYDSAVDAAAALKIPLSSLQNTLHSKSHKDKKKNLYYWYQDEYDALSDIS